MLLVTGILVSCADWNLHPQEPTDDTREGQEAGGNYDDYGESENDLIAANKTPETKKKMLI